MFSGSILQVAATCLLVRPLGIVGALLGSVANVIIPAVAAVYLAFRGGPVETIDPLMRRRVESFILFSWLGVIVSIFMWSRTELFFIQRWRPAAELANFAIGLTLAGLLTQGPILLCGALIPHFSELVGRKELEPTFRAYGSAVRLIGFTVIPSCFIGAALAPTLTPLVFGARYAEAVPVVVLLVATAATGAITSPGSSLQYAMERSAFVFVAALAGAVVAVALCVLVVPRWGAFGAAVVRAGVQLSMLTLSLYHIQHHLGCKVPLRSLAVISSSAGVAALVAFGIVRIGGNLPSTIAAAVAGGGIYLAATYFLRALQPVDVDRMLSLVRRFSAPAVHTAPAHE
jgi:O-antigen/teichoic acid export membrane protein